VVVACALVTACQRAGKPEVKPATAPAPSAPLSVTSLETRVARLEADNARYAEALEFLQKVYDQQKAQAKAEDDNEPAEDAVFAVDIAPDLAAGQIEGPVDAPVTIVEAFDFACPFCRRVHDTLADLVKAYGGKIRIVYKNMVVHPQVATSAHLAGCAAAKQKKFVAFQNEMWTKGFDPYAATHDASKLSEDAVIAIAKGVGVNIAKLKTDMKSAECHDRIDSDMAELAKFKVDATPTLFVNGTQVAGAQPVEDFKKLIDEKLALVSKSGVAPGDYYQKVIMTTGDKKFRSKKDPKGS
jgi:protein-disulfide isomerase